VKNAYINSVRIYEGKFSLVRLRRKWEENTETILRKPGLGFGRYALGQGGVPLMGNFEHRKIMFRSEKKLKF
jgi:hypothetical protein